MVPEYARENGLNRGCVQGRGDVMERWAGMLMRLLGILGVPFDGHYRGNVFAVVYGKVNGIFVEDVLLKHL